jgi:hypothetical protein
LIKNKILEMKNYLVIIISFSINLFAQDDGIQKLFPGKWEMNIENTEVFEAWEMLSETELVAKSYSIENEEEVINENLYLKKFADQWAYVAIPKNQNITLFALIEHTPKKFVFENKEHDFPQRIIYEFHKVGKLTVAIEGDVDGELKRREFSYILIED